MTDNNGIILEPVSVCPNADSKEESAGEFFERKLSADTPIVGTHHSQKEEQTTLTEVGEPTREAEEEKEPEYDFGILGAVKTTTRSDRIRETRLRTEMARESERLEALRRENEENARKEREEAERMQKALGDLSLSIPMPESKEEIIGEADTEGEGDFTFRWDYDPSTFTQSTDVTGADQTTKTIAGEGQTTKTDITGGDQTTTGDGTREGETTTENKKEGAPTTAKPEDPYGIDWAEVTRGFEEPTGFEYLHIDGVTLAHIDLSSGEAVCVSEPIKGETRQEKVTRVDTSRDNTTVAAKTKPSIETTPTLAGKEPTATEYDISSPYPDPEPRAERVRFDLGGSLEEELDRLPKNKGYIKESDNFERERELREQLEKALSDPVTEHRESPTEHGIDISPTYPDVQPKSTPTTTATREKATSEQDQRREEMLRILREAEEDEKRRRTQSATIDPVVDMERAAEVDSAPTEKREPETREPEYTFNRGQARKIKSKQSGIDLEAVEERVRAEYLELKERNAMYEYSFLRSLEDGAAKRERLRVATELKKAEERLTTAKNFEIKDNERYYRLTLVDIAHDRLPGKADRAILASYQSELTELLHRRDEINLRLIELYRGSAGGRKNFATKRLDAYISGMRSEYGRLRPRQRSISSYKISLESKKHLFTLMDQRIVLSGELSKVKHILWHEGPKGDYLRALKKERSRLEAELRANLKELDEKEKQALAKAEKTKLATAAMVAGWGIFILLCLCGVLGYVFWDSIVAWIDGLV